MIYNFSEYTSIVNVYLKELRDRKIQKDPLRFRINLRRLARCIGYEISKTLSYDQVEVQTDLGTATGQNLTKPIVIGSILRAGLPMQEGLIDVFDYAEAAFMAAYRKHHKDGSFEINKEYITCPELTGKILIITDPMIATGSSMSEAISSFKADSAWDELHIVCAIASQDGISHLQRIEPKAKIWTGAVDDELTAKAYIVPGLGDAGDLCYGGKTQD